jgi:hypothetical protein
MYDLHLEREVDASDLNRALSEIASLPPEDVMVLDSLDDLVGVPSNARLRVILTRRPLGFRTSVQVYPQYASVLDVPEAVLGAALCRCLHTRCLIPNAAVDPYLWTLVRSDGSHTSVSVNVDALAEHECLVLSEAP